MMKISIREAKILSPPILGTLPVCEVRLLGRTTILRLLAKFNTKGIVINPIMKVISAVRYGNCSKKPIVCSILFLFCYILLKKICAPTK